jgi:hypothetical protein
MRRLAVFVSVCTLATGCLSWQSGFKDPVVPEGKILAQDTSALMEKAASLSLVADNREKVEEIIGLYASALAKNPADYDALVAMANLKLLIGAAYAQSTAETAEVFIDSIRLNERAMYTNPEFRRRVDEGQTVWEASDALTIREIDAAGFWVTGIFYYYRHVFGKTARMFNSKWIMRAKTVMEHMDKLDPEWGGGALYFTWGLLYHAMPSFAGGDKARATEFFAKSVETGPKIIRNRWIRAKYFYPVIGDTKALNEEIEWILRQDPKNDGGYAQWNYFFIADAKMMQAELNSR